MKSGKRNSNDFKLDDLFESFYSKDTAKFPSTVPIAKSTTRNSSILSDIFDSNNDPKHLSASVALQRRRQPSQQVFVSNNKLVREFINSEIFHKRFYYLCTEIF